MTLNIVYILILLVSHLECVIPLDDDQKRSVLVIHDEIKEIEGIYRVSGVYNDAYAYENENAYAIARDGGSWVLGTMVPEPRQLCSSYEHTLNLPTESWMCEGRDSPPVLMFLTGTDVTNALYLEARLEQTERRNPKSALMLYHAAHEASTQEDKLYVPNILLGIGMLSRHFGLTEDAVKYLKMSSKHPSTSLTSLTILGSVLHESKAFEEALKVRLQVSVLDSQNFDVFRSLGETYAKLERYRDALESFQKARDRLEEDEIPYSARMPYYVSETRAPLIWALVLTGIGNSLRAIGKDADLIWSFGSRVGIWPNMYRRFVIPWRHKRSTQNLKGRLPVFTKADLQSCDENDSLFELNEAVQLLEMHFPEIQHEILSVMEEDRTHSLLVKESENLHQGIDWSHIRFTDRGHWNDQVETWFPKTSQVLRQIYPFDMCASQRSRKCPSQLFVQISELSPGTIITPHCGNTNLRLRIHLPIRVPCISCAGLHVQGSQIVQWKEGEAFAFDDSFEHEAWHNISDALNPNNLSRIVLIVDIWHPDVDIKLRERFLLE